jgi:seryl-tRNA synthetase
MEIATIVIMVINGCIGVILGLIIYTYKRDIQVNEKAHSSITERLLRVEVEQDEYEEKRNKTCGEHSKIINDMKIQMESRKSDIQVLSQEVKALKENISMQLGYMKETQDRIEKDMKKSFDSIFDILNNKIHKS